MFWLQATPKKAPKSYRLHLDLLSRLQATPRWCSRRPGPIEHKLEFTQAFDRFSAIVEEQLGEFLRAEGYDSLSDFVAYISRLDDCSALLVDILLASCEYAEFFRFMTDV